MYMCMYIYMHMYMNICAHHLDVCLDLLVTQST